MNYDEMKDEAEEKFNEYSEGKFHRYRSKKELKDKLLPIFRERGLDKEIASVSLESAPGNWDVYLTLKHPEKYKKEPEVHTIEKGKDPSFYASRIEDYLEQIRKRPEEEEEKEEEKEEEGLTRQIREIALQTTVKKKEREIGIANLLYDEFMDKYGDIYETFYCGLQIPPRDPKAVTLQFGAIVPSDSTDSFVRLSHSEYLIETDFVDPSDWRTAYNNLCDLTELLDKDRTAHPTITRKIETLFSMTRFDIRQGNLPEDLFLTRKEGITVKSLSITFFTERLMAYLRDESKAAWAAQLVYWCKQGVEPICNLIKNKLGREPKIGKSTWYLWTAYMEYQEGEFDRREFLQVYYDVAYVGEREEKVKKKIQERRARL